jgi:hypothetical protein
MVPGFFSVFISQRLRRDAEDGQTDSTRIVEGTVQ